MVRVVNIEVKDGVYNLVMAVWVKRCMDKFRWSIKTKSVQEKLFAWMCVGSWINWEKPFEGVSENKFNPSVILISLDHQEEHLELMSPVTTGKDGLLLLMSFKNFWK